MAELDFIEAYEAKLNRSLEDLESKRNALKRQQETYMEEKKRYDALNAEPQTLYSQLEEKNAELEADKLKLGLETTELSERKNELDAKKKFHDEMESTFFDTTAKKVASKTIVRFNVRGTIIETTPEVCQPSGYLYALLTTKMDVPVDETGAILVDVSPHLLKLLLNALSLYILDEPSVATRLCTGSIFDFRKLYNYLELYEFMAVSVPIYVSPKKYPFKFTHSFVYQFDDIADYKVFFTSADTESIRIFKSMRKELIVDLYLKIQSVRDIFDCELLTGLHGHVPLAPGSKVCLAKIYIKIMNDKFVISTSVSDNKQHIQDYLVYGRTHCRGTHLKCEYPIDDFIAKVDSMEAI